MSAQEGGAVERADDERDVEILYEWSPREIEEYHANEDRGRRAEDADGAE